MNSFKQLLRITAVLVVALLIYAVVGYALFSWSYFRQTHATVWCMKYDDVIFDGGKDRFAFVAWGREVRPEVADVTICLADDTLLYLPRMTQEDVAELAKRVHGDAVDKHIGTNPTRPTYFAYHFGQYDSFYFLDGKLDGFSLSSHGVGPFSGARIARGESEKYIALPATREEIEAAFGKPIRVSSGSLYTP